MSSTIKRSIAQLKSGLERGSTELKKLVAQPNATTQNGLEDQIDGMEILKAKLQGQIAKIETRAEEWQQVINNITDKDEKADEEKEAACEAEDKKQGYFRVFDIAEKSIDEADLRLRALRRALDACASNTANASSGSDAQQKSKGTAKLPKLELPHFNGDYLKWPEFWNIFHANINQQEITGTEKFSYLLSLLEGKAKDTVEGITITDANYDHAVDLLKKRFDRKSEERITSLYAQLIKLPASSKSYDDQRKTYDSIEKILRQLENTGENLGANHSLTIGVLSKFPDRTVSYLQQHYKCSAHTDLSIVRKTLLEYLNDMEKLQDTLSTFRKVNDSSGGKSEKSDKNQSDQKPGQGGKPFGHGQGSPWRQSGPNGGRPKTFGGFGERSNQSVTMTTFDRQTAGVLPFRPCVFCGEQHFHGECPKFTTIEDRMRRLHAGGICAKCLRPGHAPEKCKNRSPTRCYFCDRMNRPPSEPHQSCLCPFEFYGQSSTGQRSKKGQESPKDKEKSTPRDKRKDDSATNSRTWGGGDCSMLSHGGKERSLLMTAVTQIRNPETGAEVTARLVFDSASHRSFILDSTARQMKLRSAGQDDLHIAVFGTKNRVSLPTQSVTIDIKLRNGNAKTIDAHTTSVITNSPLLPEFLQKDDRRFFNTMQYAMADDVNSSDGSVQVLIGGDYFWEFMEGAKMTTPSGLFLIPSLVGLLLAGRYTVPLDKDSTDQSTFLCITESRSKFPSELGLIASAPGVGTKQQDVDEFWNLENIGITDDPKEVDDEKAQKMFDETIRYDEKEGRYQMGWLWKEGMKEKLPDNFGLALGRFKMLHRRFQREDGNELKAAYQKTIDYQLENGIIERVPRSQVRQPLGPVHVLPHHPVVRADRSKPARIVYDASSKTGRNSVALNECLYRGPVILPDLCKILIRFRLHNIAIIADIEKAFLQLGLLPEHRDATRFLWYDDPKKLTVDDNLAIYRFCRVAFGVICSPFLLGATIRHHLSRSECTTAAKIIDDVYVDNLVTGARNLSEANTFYVEAKEIFAEAGMNIREWCSNSSEICDLLPEADRVSSRTTKVLGLTWNSSKDVLTLSTTNWQKQSGCETKREVLSAIASIFDPLGFYQPAILPAKSFLQSLWMDGHEWDDKISESRKIEWTKIHEAIAAVLDHETPRNVLSDHQVGILAFCDASTVAYATAVYLVDRNSTAPRSNLVFAKSKLAPTKNQKITLPRLELLGLLLGAKASNFVRQAITPGKTDIPIHLFTDSEIAIHWIRSKKPLTRFVENRVKSIQELTINCKVHHVRTDQNPADVASRGMTGKDLLENHLWWHGPSWVWKDEEEWPEGQVQYDPADNRNEPALNPVYHTILAGEGSGPTHTDPKIDDATLMMIDPNKYSSFRKMLRHSAVLLKFIRLRIWNRLSDATRSASKLKPILSVISDGPVITANDLVIARRLWIRLVQKRFCSDIINAIKQKRKHRLVQKLGLYLGEFDLIRSYGRFTNADLPTATKFPVFLPSESRFTTLLIGDTHRRLNHAGVAHTLSELRQEFWIHRARFKVSTVIATCLTCRRIKGPPFALPDMPAWPRERVAKCAPFEFTGIDYFGPVNVKIHTETHKVWVCLLTCLSVRAVHLEWVLDCSSQEFLNALIRFVSRRGLPKQIVCDNAAQFRVTSKVTERMWNQVVTDSAVQSYCADRGIRWDFITEFAPWQGGVYERLVGVVKTSMKAAIGRRLLHWSEFATLLAGTEAIVNSRPITYVYGDTESRAFTLRPIDFLLDTSSRTGLPIDSNESLFKTDLGDAGKRLAAYWSQSRKRLQGLSKLWRDEYLLSMRESSSVDHRQSRVKVRKRPKIGEIVLVRDDDVPRGAWKLARVSKLIESSDGHVRSAEVTLGNDATIRRSVKHLYPLECHQFESDDPQNTVPPELAPAPEEDEPDDEFRGFSDEDIQRTLRMIQAYPDDDIALFCSTSESTWETDLSGPQCRGPPVASSATSIPESH